MHPPLKSRIDAVTCLHSPRVCSPECGISAKMVVMDGEKSVLKIAAPKLNDADPGLCREFFDETLNHKERLHPCYSQALELRLTPERSEMTGKSIASPYHALARYNSVGVNS